MNSCQIYWVQYIVLLSPLCTLFAFKINLNIQQEPVWTREIQRKPFSGLGSAQDTAGGACSVPLNHLAGGEGASGCGLYGLASPLSNYPSLSNTLLRHCQGFCKWRMSKNVDSCNPVLPHSVAYSHPFQYDELQLSHCKLRSALMRVLYRPSGRWRMSAWFLPESVYVTFGYHHNSVCLSTVVCLSSVCTLLSELTFSTIF